MYFLPLFLAKKNENRWTFLYSVVDIKSSMLKQLDEILFQRILNASNLALVISNSLSFKRRFKQLEAIFLLLKKIY